MNKRILVTAVIAAGFGTAALAQQQGQAPGQSPAPGAEQELAVLPAFDTVDANKDGMIDQTEGATLTELLEQEHEVTFEFDTVDENSDGMINDQEYVAYDAMLKERLGIA